MKSVKGASDNYFGVLKERAKNYRVHKRHQSSGLELAEILNDRAHKSLYMKLAKNYDNDELLRLAKDLAERKGITNKGAYFMKLFKNANLKKHG